MRLSKTFRAGLLTALMSVSTHSPGGGMPVFDALNYSQAILDVLYQVEQVAQEAEQVSNQIQQLQTMAQQYQDMLQNSADLTGYAWGDTPAQLQQLAQIVQNGQALAYSLAAIEDQYNQRYGGFDQYMNGQMTPKTYSNQYRTWSQTNLDTIRASLLAANLQHQQFQDENQVMAQLEQLSQTSTGRLQAIKAGSQIAAQEVRQLQKLRQLIMAQMQMQAASLAAQQDKEAAQEAAREKIFGIGTRAVVLGDSHKF